MERGVMKEGRRETGCGGDKGDLKPIASCHWRVAANDDAGAQLR